MADGQHEIVKLRFKWFLASTQKGFECNMC